MALNTKTLDAITDDLYASDIQQTWADQNLVVMSLYKGGSKKQGGERLKQVLEYQYDAGGFYDQWGSFDVSGREFLTAAYFEWRLLEVPLVIGRKQQLQNMGEPAQFDLLNATVMAGKRQAGELMAGAVFGTGIDTTIEFNGLDHLLDSAGTLASSATCGTIDRDTYTWWNGNVVDLKTDYTTYPTYENINSASADAHDGTDYPNLFVSGVKTYHTLLNEAAVSKRHVNVDGAGLGFMSATINGVRFVADRHCPEVAGESAANRMYGLNLNYIDLVTHSDEDMRRSDWATPYDATTLVSHILWAGGMTVKRPDRHLVIYNFTSDAYEA